MGSIGGIWVRPIENRDWSEYGEVEKVRQLILCNPLKQMTAYTYFSMSIKSGVRKLACLVKWTVFGPQRVAIVQRAETFLDTSSIITVPTDLKTQ